MSELRWHPLLREWVAVAAIRQDRPQMPADWCPFCPGSGQVPDHYETYLYPNDFAAFRLDSEPFDPEPGLFKTTGARGATDVVLYHPNHNLAPSQLSAEHWRKIIDLWAHRYAEMQARADLQYTYIFENTGQAIGVTMPHPHGQIYTFPFIPPYIQRELDSALQFHDAGGRCLYCEILARELQQGIRIVVENAGFVAFCPFHARWPSEISLYARRHVAGLLELSENEKDDLARIIKTVRMKYDNLYGFQMPLMMILRQPPLHGQHPYCHFHIDFFPIQRSRTKLKYLAGVESGAGTFLNDTLAEERARELRETQPTAA